MRKIVCLLLTLMLCLSLCACSTTKVIENGKEFKTLYNGAFIVLKEDWDYSNRIVYDPDTKVVFYNQGGHAGYLTPYQIYIDGIIYGAVYENGEIVPAPYACTWSYQWFDQ